MHFMGAGTFIDPKVYSGMGPSTSPVIFRNWTGWDEYFAKARNLPNYTITYKGQASVSPSPRRSSRTELSLPQPAIVAQSVARTILTAVSGNTSSLCFSS